MNIKTAFKTAAVTAVCAVGGWSPRQACAASYKGMGSDLTPLIEKVESLRRTWDTGAIVELTNASNVDWLAGDEEEADLRVILDQLAQSLRQHKLARSEASNVQAGTD